MAEVRTLAAEPDTTQVYRRFWPHLRAHRRVIVPALLVSLLSTASVVAMAPAIGQAVAAVIAGDRTALLVWSGVLGGLVIARMLLLRAAELMLTRAGEQVVRTLRDLAVEGLAGAPLRFVEAHRAGELLRRATGEIAELAAFVRQHVPDLLAILSTLGMTFVVLFVYSWLLTLVVLVLFVPAAAFVVRWFKRDADTAFAAKAAAEAAVSARFTETITAHEVLVTGGGMAERLALLDADVATARTAAMRAVAVQTRLTATGFVEGLATATLLLVGALLAAQGQVGVAAVVVFVLATRNMFDGFRGLSDLVAQLQTAKIGLARLLDLFDAASPHVGDKAGDGVLPAAGELVVEDVEYGYGGAPVLAGTVLRIAQGERVGLVGETGCGKTTLAKLLSGLYEPDSGSVRFGDVGLTSVEPAERRRRIVLVPQAVHTITATVADNIGLIPSRPDRAAMEAAVDALGVRDWVDGLPDGLDTVVGSGGRRLSAGEQQLIGLVRAALTDPAVLILDEATSDIDPTLARQLEAAVEGLRADRTLVVVAHRESTIERLPRVVRLVEGRITDGGTT
ncbi:ABC transporter ATP-binding protein [Pseudonocardia sp. TRM90224]|uniref:ABC transporter ATP-binding protein n=1 Tax=Pseudonocardia sp. TRM90224 TaxID=2812678 RepID=UPI001E44F072|nr:ABC transporter ATP-binding protein [Pseudonocardia sp. TRM90224]